MYDAVLAGCRWLENTPWGVAVRASSWMYPLALWVHFVGLSVWLATSLAVDLRLMGVGSRQLNAVELSTGLFAWNWIGFAIAFVGGFLLLSAEATTYAANTGDRQMGWFDRVRALDFGRECLSGFSADQRRHASLTRRCRQNADHSAGA